MGEWRRKIVAWGNSLAIRLPSQIFRQTTFKKGDIIEFQIMDDDTIRLSHAEVDDEAGKGYTATPMEEQ